MQDNKQDNAAAKSLNSYSTGFVLESSMIMLFGIFLICLPLVLYARLIFLIRHFISGEASILWQAAAELFFFVFLPLCGFVCLIYGFFYLYNSILYISCAKKNIAGVEPVDIQICLTPRKNNWLFLRPILLAGDITYSDGRQETIKLFAHNMDIQSIINKQLSVKIFGLPYALSTARIFQTDVGKLIEEPDMFWTAINHDFSSKTDIGKRIFEKFLRLLPTLVILFSAPSLCKWFASHDFQEVQFVIYPTCLITLLLEVFGIVEDWKILKIRKLSNPVPTWLTMNNSNNWFTGTKAVKTKFKLEGEQIDREDTFETSNVGKRLCGYQLKGLAYIDKFGKVPHIVSSEGLNFALWKSSFHSLFYIPLLVYIISIVFACQQMLQRFQTRGAFVPLGLICSNAQQYYDLGKKYQQFGWTEQSRGTLLKAISLGDKDVTQEAKRFLLGKLPRHPASTEAQELNIEGDNLMFSNKEIAKERFEKCITKYPDFECPYSSLATIDLSEGRTQEAVKLLDKALTINPQYTDALNCMGEAQLILGNKELAYLYLAKAIQSDPHNLLLWLQIFAIKTSI